MSLDYVDARCTELAVRLRAATLRRLDVLFEFVPLEEPAYQFGISAGVVYLIENVIPADRIAGLIFVRSAFEFIVGRCAARSAVVRFSICRVGIRDRFTIYTGGCLSHRLETVCFSPFEISLWLH